MTEQRLTLTQQEIRFVKVLYDMIINKDVKRELVKNEKAVIGGRKQ